MTVADSGDASYAGSTSAPITQHVVQVPTTTTATSIVSPAPFGDDWIVDTTVTPASYVSGLIPSGALQLMVDGKPVGTPLPIKTAAAAAGSPASQPAFGPTATVRGSIGPNAVSITIRCTWSPLRCTITIIFDALSAVTVGSHAVQVAYSGDADFAGSKTTAFAQQVTKVATKTTVRSNRNPAGYGQNLTLTATVTPAGTGAFVTPTGRLSVFVDGVAVSEHRS